MITTQQKDQALIAFVGLVYGYLKNKKQLDDQQQRTALTALVEGWNALSIDGKIDDEVIAQLERRGLFAKKVVEPTPSKAIAAHNNPQFTDLSQPNGYTCQATMICSALGMPASKIPEVRAALTQGGQAAGDPHVMAQYMRPKLGDRYELHLTASINEIQGWLEKGAFLITHGYLTAAGHVFGLDGYSIKGGRRWISVKDPWDEFDFLNYRYSKKTNFYDGDYSELGVYSAIMAWSISEARQLYQEGVVDRDRKAAYVHVIWPKK